MQMRSLGMSNVKVSPIIFGAWAIGGWMWGGNEEADSIAAIQASLDNGVNTIDTAAIYGMGDSEILVGKAIAGRRRDQIILATKCGMRWDGDQGADPWANKDNAGKEVTVRKNSKRDSIVYEIEESLKRLKTDYIDLYQIHWPDKTTPVEESITAMNKLLKAGKIKAVGVSNYNVEWLTKGLAAGAIHSLQPPYSLINRGIESEILPFCREKNIGVIVYSPLERGLLTGKVGPDRTFAPGDHRAGHKFFTVENRKRILAALAKIQPIADAHKASLAQVVINWTVHEPGITAALVGARNAEQATHNAAALNFKLSDTERASIRAVFDEPSRAMAG